jgi:hypothetical protein
LGENGTTARQATNCTRRKTLSINPIIEFFSKTQTSRLKIETKSHTIITLLILGSLTLLLLPVPHSSAQNQHNVTINSLLNNTINGNNVPIMQDGITTGFTTPHTFTALSGTHNFSVPYQDSAGHPFRAWNGNINYSRPFTTVTVSTGGTYWANYDVEFNRTSCSWAESHYFVTPLDPAVVAAASNKSWNDILDWVAHKHQIQRYFGPMAVS